LIRLIGQVTYNSKIMIPKKILLVDKDPSIITILEFILAQSGYQVLTSNTSSVAIDILKKNRDINLIFLDYNMPKLSNTPLHQKIQTISPLAITIFMAGQQYEKLLQNAYEAGAYSILYKPFDIEEVLVQIKTIFKTVAEK
jgi:DNA-binding NtrC family response regulator